MPLLVHQVLVASIAMSPRVRAQRVRKPPTAVAGFLIVDWFRAPTTRRRMPAMHDGFATCRRPI